MANFWYQSSIPVVESIKFIQSAQRTGRKVWQGTPWDDTKYNFDGGSVMFDGVHPTFASPQIL